MIYREDLINYNTFEYSISSKFELESFIINVPTFPKNYNNLVLNYQALN